MNEERSFYWRLTGRQNLRFFGALDDGRGQAFRRRIDELLDLTGLAGAADVRVSDYSCGMRQRLAIARGLLADPDVLILDEPTHPWTRWAPSRSTELISQRVHAAGPDAHRRHASTGGGRIV